MGRPRWRFPVYKDRKSDITVLSTATSNVWPARIWYWRKFVEKTLAPKRDFYSVPDGTA